MGMKARNGIQLALDTRSPFVNDLLALANDEVNYRTRIHVGDTVDVNGDSGTDITDATVIRIDDDVPVVQWTANGTTHECLVDEDDWVDVKESPFAADIWERHQKESTPDGVAWGDDLVGPELRSRLCAHLDRLCSETPVDYHPGSGTAVRDLVHPSLYPYVEGTSSLGPDARAPGASSAPSHDLWGRPYEASRFQWLPTDLRVDEMGAARWQGYINNLDRDAFAELYRDLEELFATALPLFESVYGFARHVEFWNESTDDCEADLPEPAAYSAPPEPVPSVSLRGRELQVITKIVEYRIDSENNFEGVWHVEGMSHENILATGVYVLQRDEQLLGGDIRFRRAYSRHEAGQLFWNIAQCRTGPVDAMVNKGLVPNGSLATPEGRLFVFPNSHIHKLSDLVSATGQAARRRVIVFWLVNPETPILSTSDVPRQQAVMSRADALRYRLELMEERRLHKQSHNVREVSLCEH